MSNQIQRSVIVRGDISTVFDVWANFETFPHFMTYINEVEKIGPRTSNWKVDGPMGVKLVWTAETTRHEPNQRIAWNTKDNDGNMTTSGEVVFSELPDQQTHVNVTMQYVAPGGKLGEAVAQLFANPEKRLEEDLRNFKAYVENGLY